MSLRSYSLSYTGRKTRVYSGGMNLRIGYGEDAHTLKTGRPLVVGGVEVPSPVGAVAHSDGDVLLHALSDALLSTAALGDIGKYFPPSDAKYKDMASSAILEYVLNLLNKQGQVTLHNIAAVVTLDAPKLAEVRGEIQGNVARLLDLEPDKVGVAFKTSEGLATGHIQARATVLLSLEPLS